VKAGTKPPPQDLVRAEREAQALGALPAREIQELWFATLRRPWRTLALIPSHPGRSALPLARALAQFGSFHRRRPLTVLSAEGMGLQEIAEMTIEMEFGASVIGGASADPAPTIIVLEPIITNPLGTALALCADAVLLCVSYGSSDLEGARKTIEQIGAERFIGCVALKPGP
jgi:hypothetical protein